MTVLRLSGSSSVEVSLGLWQAGSRSAAREASCISYAFQVVSEAFTEIAISDHPINS